MKEFLENKIVGNLKVLNILRVLMLVSTLSPYIITIIFPNMGSEAWLFLFLVPVYWSILCSMTAFVRKGWKILPLIGLLISFFIIIFGFTPVYRILGVSDVLLINLYIWGFFFNFLLFVFSYNKKTIGMLILQIIVSFLSLIGLTGLYSLSSNNAATSLLFGICGILAFLSLIVLVIVGNAYEARQIIKRK